MSEFCLDIRYLLLNMYASIGYICILMKYNGNDLFGT